MLHKIHNGNNSIYSQILFHSGSIGAPVSSQILEFLLKCRIKKLTIGIDIATNTYDIN